MFINQLEINIRPLGDSALVVKFGNEISPLIHKQVIQLVEIVEKEPFDGFIEAVPSYTNVTIFYNPVTVYYSYQQESKKTLFEVVGTFIESYINKISDSTVFEHRLVEIPVIYGGQFGPDLEYVAKSNHISIEEVINIHSENEYLVYMIGFAPGFPFLGGMDEKIATPRKKSPRPSIPSGSVGIAGKQTGVYPFETPGGWQIIGRTPLELFLPNMSPPTRLQSGDKVRFIPITQEEYYKYKEGMAYNEH